MTKINTLTKTVGQAWEPASFKRLQHFGVDMLDDVCVCVYTPGGRHFQAARAPRVQGARAVCVLGARATLETCALSC